MVFFRYWNFTTCIDCNDLNVLEREIIQLLEQEEGCYCLAQLPKLDFEPEQLRLNYPEEKLPNLWIVALFKSDNQWTVIKTFPTGILCHRAKGANRPRLSYLTEQLNCNAFHLEVHRDVEGFLLETDPAGNTFLSGCSEEAYDKFYDEPQVKQPDLIQQFSLIDVPESMQAAININESPEAKRQEVELRELDPNVPKYFDLVIANPGYTQRIDLAMADLFDPERAYWFLKSNLAYKVYQEPQELESAGAILFYFHPPSSYQPFLTPKVDLSLNENDSFSENEDEIPF